MNKLLRIAAPLAFILIGSVAAAKKIYDPNGKPYDCGGETQKDCLSDCNLDNGCDYNESGSGCCYESGGVIYAPIQKKRAKSERVVR